MQLSINLSIKAGYSSGIFIELLLNVLMHQCFLRSYYYSQIFISSMIMRQRFFPQTGLKTCASDLKHPSNAFSYYCPSFKLSEYSFHSESIFPN